MKIRKMFLTLIVGITVYFSNGFIPVGIDKICKIIDKSPIENTEIVRKATSFLPNADNVGAKILHLNEILINNILNNPGINDEYKKQFILKIIELAQMGDETGSMILQSYHDLIQCLL